MKSLEVWRKGYKADFSPWRWRSKCKVSPLPCLPWDSVGGVGQGRFCILHKSGIDSPILWRSPGLSLCPCMLGLLAVWPERLGAGSVGGAGWAALFYCHFLAVPLFPFLSPVSLSSPFHLLGGAGSAVWLAGGLHQLGAAGCPLPSCWPWVLCWLPWVQALAAVLSLPCVLSLSWVLALGAGAAVSLCPLSWVLAFLCCPLVLACYALGLGAGLGRGRC